MQLYTTPLRKDDNMKKNITIFTLICIILVGSIPVYASNVHIDEDTALRTQADALIAQVDVEALFTDALAGVVDYSVPLSIRENISASAEFTPVKGVSKNEIEFEVSSTVKKVGEVTQKNGQTANMYVAVATATQVKDDMAYTSQHGIKAWAYISWIDVFGVNNELYSASGHWDTQDKVVRNRELRYGTSDILGLTWSKGPTVKYPTGDWARYEDPASYVGFTLRCQTKIEVVNIGTVTCNVTSGLLT